MLFTLLLLSGLSQPISYEPPLISQNLLTEIKAPAHKIKPKEQPKEPEADPSEQADSGIQCIDRDKLVKNIQEKYGAVPLFVALTNVGIALEVWRDSTSKMWIEFGTKPDGQSCVMFQGTAYGIASSTIPIPGGDKL
jgi:hypothetical protein